MKRKNPNTSKILREKADALAWYEALAQEIETDEVEAYQFTSTTFKKDGKWYVIALVDKHGLSVKSTASQRNMTGRIIVKKGKNTKWEKGEWA